MRNYIGLALSAHDPALAIVNSNGELVFAEATERYLQDKRAWHCAPDHHVYIDKLVKEHCEPGMDIVIATSWKRRFAAAPWIRRGVATKARLQRARAKRRWLGGVGECESFAADFMAGQIDYLTYRFPRSLKTSFANLAFRTMEGAAIHKTPRAVLPRAYDHHRAHAATGCYSGPFDRAVCAVVEGFGEASSIDFFDYRDGRLEQLPGVKRSIASLGNYYGLVCWACGFDLMKGEQWKVMGLAPYGKRDERFYDLLRPMIRVQGLQLVSPPDIEKRRGELLLMRRDESASPREAADLACTAQIVFCEVMSELLNNLHERTGQDNLVLCGGSALNSAYNGSIIEQTPFKAVHIPSAPGDDGNAVGAALLAYFEDHPPSCHPRRYAGPYLGASLSDKMLAQVQKYSGLKMTRLRPEEVPERAAEVLSEGKIIGWAQGRAEFGPRALGNRSILADPRRPDIKEVINARVKFREEYRPFAPSILHEHGPEYFENYQESRYMERTLRFKPEVCDRVPGVVHVDGTGRLQTIKRDWNQRFHDLVAAFHRRTGVPTVLNTSFNVMGKPIIHSVHDAVMVFCSSGLDAMFVDDMMFEKPTSAP